MENTMTKTSSSKKSAVTYETALYITGWCLIGSVLLLIILFRLQLLSLDRFLLPCMLYTLTGVYCPGCGGTRAVLYLLQGHPLKTLIYHPLVFYTAVFGGWFMLSQTIDRLSGHRLPIGMKYHDNYLWAAIIIVAVNFILKNFFLFVLHIDLLAI